MTRSYVFVDVETTGLNDKRDRIIEVAAVVWEGGEVIESFSSLVDPERDIPFEITQLTGIDNAMVREAPHMSAIHRKLSTLIGDRIVVGHNVDFDLGFLKAEDLAFGNHKIDTVVLASILAPESGRFNLEHLVHHFDLPQTVAHRAEADAHHTLNLFVKLQEICMQQDALLIEEIVEVSIAIRWPEALFFQDVLTTRAQATFSRDGEAVRSRRQRDHQLLHLPRIEGKILPDPSELEPEKEQPIDIEAVTGMFKTGSNFSRVFPNFEPRKEQVQMVSAVAGALNKHKHLMVEAGTGTGKSLAYLIPAAFWAHQNDRRVVISTNTINLQDQLINKDIPAMNKALPFKIEVAVRKGRRNYVCGALFGRLRQHLPNNKDEMALFARMLLWLPKTKTGDVAEIPLRTVAERKAWRELSGEQSRCNQTGCTAEDCAVTHARRRAESAHIVIVNHALLMSDVANENHILPPFKELIIDEAHHFEAAVTGGMSFSADPQSLTALLDNLTNNTLKVLETDLMSLPKGAYDDLRNHWWLVEQGATTARLRLQELFATLAFFGGSYWNKKSPFPESVRLVREVRDSDGFRLVRRDWANLNINFKSIIKHISALDKGIGQLQGNNIEFEKDQEWCKILGSVYKDIEKVRDKLDKIIEHEDEGQITWIEWYRDQLSLHAAPLHVGKLVDNHMWERLDSVILTSATMRTAPQGRQNLANFDYIRARLQADEETVQELSVGSPFNYKKNTLLYLCSDIPEPRQPGYQRMVEEAIVDIATTYGGQTLVLFTSYKQLSETARIIEPKLAEENIRVLAQTQKISRQQLTAQFKADNARAVLLGTKSFWEGVDVPGPALSAVVLVKLPFDVPTDPVIGARSETFNNSFMEYALPESVLRFRQGFGRLIRRKSDEGVVVVLDKRVLTKRYGELFINALPQCVTLRKRTQRIPEILKRWQNRDRS